MKPFRIYSAVLATAGILTVGSIASAQSALPVLDRLTVLQLAGSTESNDQAQLAAHFNALANTYAAESVRDDFTAATMMGNPNRRSGMSPGSIWASRAERNATVANTLRGLARHYELLAFGLPSVAPPDSARFENGAGAPAPTPTQVAIASARARTAHDHAVLTEYFLAEAERLEGIAEGHAAIAAAFRANPNRRGGDPAVHCERIVKQSREAAAVARNNAAQHRTFAPIG